MDQQAESEEWSSSVSDHGTNGGPITLQIKEEPEWTTEYDAVGQGFVLAVSVKEETFDSDGFAQLDEPHTPPEDWCTRSALAVKGDNTTGSQGGTPIDEVTAAHYVVGNPDASLDVSLDASLMLSEDSHERLTYHKSATHDFGDESAGIDEENSDLADDGWVEKPPSEQESLRHVSGVRNGRETADLLVHPENHAGISGMSVLRQNECDVCHKCLSTPKALKVHMKIHTGERKFHCEQCGVSFIQKGSLTRHIRIHTGERPYRCELCGSSFRSKNHIARHRLIHTGERPFNCDICQASFKDKSYLRCHMRTHTGETPYQCEMCLKRFRQRSSLTCHLKIHGRTKRFKCHVCGKTFHQKCNMEAHMRHHSGETPPVEKSFKCQLCPKEFSAKCKLSAHMKCHTREKPFECYVCFRRYSHKSNLNFHVKRHADDVLFKCNICMQDFQTFDELLRHGKEHIGGSLYDCVNHISTNELMGNIRARMPESSLVCNLCFLRFGSKKKYRTHVRSHKQDSKRIHKCTVCDKEYDRRSLLDCHMSGHTGNKSFLCAICGVGFFTRSGLRRHFRAHSSERPFTCEICSKTFTQRYILARHQKIHTVKESFKCDVCSKEFLQKFQLSSHHRIHTG